MIRSVMLFLMWMLPVVCTAILVLVGVRFVDPTVVLIAVKLLGAASILTELLLGQMMMLPVLVLTVILATWLLLSLGGKDSMLIPSNRHVIELLALRPLLNPEKVRWMLVMACRWPLAAYLMTIVMLFGLQFLKCALLHRMFLSLLAVPPTVCLTPLPGTEVVIVPLSVSCRCGPLAGLLLLECVVITTLCMTPANIPFWVVLRPFPWRRTPVYPERFVTGTGLAVESW